MMSVAPCAFTAQKDMLLRCVLYMSQGTSQVQQVQIEMDQGPGATSRTTNPFKSVSCDVEE